MLVGEVDMKDAVYDGPLGLKYVPAGLSMEKLRRVDYQRLKDAVDDLRNSADYVIIDCPSGLAIDAETALKSAKEAIVVTMPEPSSLADALKVKNFAEKSNVNVLGIVCNMCSGDRTEVSSKDISTLLDAPMLVEIPVDLNVRRASSLQEPVFLKYPNTSFSLAMRVLAAKAAGEALVEERIKKHWLQELIEALLEKLRFRK